MQSLDALIFKLNIFTVPPLVVGILMFVLGLMDLQMPVMGGLEAGMNDFLARPVDPDKLREKIWE